MAQQFLWPPLTTAGGAAAANASVAPNSGPIPGSSTLIAGDAAGVQTPVDVDSSGRLNVNVISAPAPAGAATSANQVLEITQLTGIHSDTTSLDGKTVHVDTGAVVVASSALPTGASTSALQGTGNTSLASIDTKTPTVGQKTMAASSPVVIASDQSAVPVSGTVTVTPGVGNFTVVQSSPANLMATVSQPTGTNLHTVIDSGTLIVTQATGTNLHTVVDSLPAIPTGTNTIGTVLSKAATPTALTVTQAAKTIGTTAARLTVSGSAPTSTRVVLVVTPDSASTAKFYIGSSSVTSSGATRGIQILASQTFTANSDAGDYYIISDTAAQTVYVMEQQ